MSWPMRREKGIVRVWLLLTLLMLVHVASTYLMLVHVALLPYALCRLPRSY